ncbi:hypothetical protein GCM10023184_34970 [Flaviaesturariibacter amylovorans]|uniref:Uncharacterized protein n=1 Tax=Flaviaesturariibacter amylovorans TaxID=1084520 RepID=A0ABP8HF26_9BACT
MSLVVISKGEGMAGEREATVPTNSRGRIAAPGNTHSYLYFSLDPGGRSGRLEGTAVPPLAGSGYACHDPGLNRARQPVGIRVGAPPAG